ncbi:hypothetical protein [Streptomyces cinereoruber]|uniref:hypothetical protein n=1 Tax=Streptomyces cinereoruber TaxID=67260 RepID=UPI003C2F1FF2
MAAGRLAAQPDDAKPARRTAPAKTDRSTATKRTTKASAPKRKAPVRKTTVKPRPTKPKKGTAPSRKPTTANPPEMRQLCRQAQGINAPMGAPELCRSMYGR